MGHVADEVVFHLLDGAQTRHRAEEIPQGHRYDDDEGCRRDDDARHLFQYISQRRRIVGHIAASGHDVVAYRHAVKPGVAAQRRVAARDAPVSGHADYSRSVGRYPLARQ